MPNKKTTYHTFDDLKNDKAQQNIYRENAGLEKEKLSSENYQKRIQEEIAKFAELHDINYELVEQFIWWVEWFAKQDEKKKIINAINNF